MFFSLFVVFSLLTFLLAPILIYFKDIRFFFSMSLRTIETLEGSLGYSKSKEVEDYGLKNQKSR